MKHTKTWQAPSTTPLPINTGTETLHTTADWNVSRALPFSLFLFHPLAWAENADRSMDARWLGQYKDTPVLSPTPMSFSCEHMWQLNRQIQRKCYHENKTHPPPTEKRFLARNMQLTSQSVHMCSVPKPRSTKYSHIITHRTRNHILYWLCGSSSCSCSHSSSCLGNQSQWANGTLSFTIINTTVTYCFLLYAEFVNTTV